MKRKTLYDWLVVGVYLALGCVIVVNYQLSKRPEHDSTPYYLTMAVLLSITQINRIYDVARKHSKIGPFAFLGIVIGLAVFLIAVLVIGMFVLGV